MSYNSAIGDEGMVEIPDKRYFKIGEVSQLTGLEPYVIRYWESEFEPLKPLRAGSSQRLYTRADVELILAIQRLLYEEKYTIAGAKKKLTQEPLAAEEEIEAAPAQSPPLSVDFDKPRARPFAVPAWIKAELRAILKVLS